MEWLNHTEHSPELCNSCLNMQAVHGFTYSTRDQINNVAVASVLLPRKRSEEEPLAPGEIDSEDSQPPMDLNDDFPMDDAPLAFQRSAGPSTRTSTEAAGRQLD